MGQIIYLVDSGIDTSHQKFSTTYITNLYTYDGSFIDNDGHGTGVASVLVNVTPDITLKNVKIDIKGDCTFGQMMEAFTAIINDNPETVSVVNCSWAVPRHPIVDNKVAELNPEKFIVVAAAGNEITSASAFSPVNMESVIGVAACDDNYTVRSWNDGRGSNWGPEVTVTARGIDVEVVVPKNGTAIASGTSLATALVSSKVAQLIQQYPEKNALEIKEILLQSATPNLLIRDEQMYGTTPNLLIHR
jgi:subtilisin family serine protease